MPLHLPSEPPQPRKRPQQERSRLTVDAILEAALQVFSTGGHASLTTTAVAARAGVSVGTLYQYFPDRDALVSGLVERWHAEKRAALEAAWAEARQRPLAEAADALVDAFARAVTRDPEPSALLLGGIAVGWQARLDAALGEMAAAVAGLLRTRGATPDPDLAAFVAVHAVVGAVMRGAIDRPEDAASGAVTREAKRLVRGYLGLGAPSEAEDEPPEAASP